MAQQPQVPWQLPRHALYVGDFPLITESSTDVTFPTPELITNNINNGIIEEVSASDLVQGETYIIEKSYNSGEVGMSNPPFPKVYAPILLIGTLSTIDVDNKTHNNKDYVGGVFTFTNLEKLTGLNPTTKELWRSGPKKVWVYSSKIIEGVKIGFPSVEKYYKINPAPRAPENEEIADCLICANKLDEESGIKVHCMSCTEWYHQTCAMRWCNIQHNCPKCRTAWPNCDALQQYDGDIYGNHNYNPHNAENRGGRRRRSRKGIKGRKSRKTRKARKTRRSRK